MVWPLSPRRSQRGSRRFRSLRWPTVRLAHRAANPSWTRCLRCRRRPTTASPSTSFPTKRVSKAVRTSDAPLRMASPSSTFRQKTVRSAPTAWSSLRPASPSRQSSTSSSRSISPAAAWASAMSKAASSSLRPSRPPRSQASSSSTSPRTLSMTAIATRFSSRLQSSRRR